MRYNYCDSILLLPVVQILFSFVLSSLPYITIPKMKENTTRTKDKIETQHIHLKHCDINVSYVWSCLISKQNSHDQCKSPHERLRLEQLMVCVSNNRLGLSLYKLNSSSVVARR